MHPAVSVIIPTRNRADILKDTLPILLDQDFGDREYEVVIVNDDSPDATEEVLDPWRDHPRLKTWKLAREGTSAMGRARNHAIRAAEGEVLVFVDDDCFVGRDYLSVHYEAHKAQERMVASGPIIYIHDAPRDVEREVRAIAKGHHNNPFPTCNASIRRDFLLSCGLFDEEFNVYGWEDMEIWERFREAGARRRYLRSAGVLHYKPTWTRPHFRDRLRTEVRRGAMGALYYSKWPRFGVGWQTKQLAPIRALDAGLNALLGLDRRVLDILAGADPPQSNLLRFFIKEHAEISGARLLPKLNELPG